MKKLLYILLAVATIGCSKQDNFDIASGDNQAVSFTITEDATRSMSAKTEWMVGDKIAIFDGDNDAANSKIYEVKSISGNDAILAPSAGVTGYIVPAISTTYTAYHYSQVEVDKAKPLSDFKALSVQEDALIATSTVDARSLSGSFTFTHLYSFITLGGVKGAKVKITNGTTVLLAETEKITTDTHEFFLNSVEDISDCVITATIGVNAYTIPAQTAKITTWAAGIPYTYNIYTAIDIAYNNKVCEIYTAKGLEAFSQMVSAGKVTNDPVVFGAKVDEIITAATDRTKIKGKLMANIDLSSICNEGDNTSWSPIGVSDNKYAGTFDGNGFEVQNLYINATENNQGLFGITNGANIKNLGVTGSVTSTSGNTYYYAGIVGRAMNTQITDCYNKATIDNNYNTGGIAGEIDNESTVINCYNAGKVSSRGLKCGGIVGNSEGSIKSCYNTGEINSTSYYIGGIVGFNSAEAIISDCYNLGDVTNTNMYLGGIAGKNDGYITNCYNGGNISSTNLSVGGVVGDNSGTVVNIYNLGSVKGSQEVGGIVGYVGASGIVKIGYNVGEVTATNSTKDGNVVGDIMAGGSVSDCYYLSTLTAGTNTNGTSKSKEDMQTTDVDSDEIPDFVAELNGLLLEYSGTPYACKWNPLSNGYPTLDFGNVAAN